MIFSFDYYHNLVDVDLYLCNPDGRELFPLKGMNRKLILRFNDLSELTFDAYPTTTLSDGTEVYLEMYDYLETKRLIYATDIGWFQIARIDENDNGIVKYKTVTAESHQAIFKNKGVTTEERVYCFYNPADPYDDYYDSSDENQVPSVVGQMCNQLGINLDLKNYGEESVKPYDDWTITYINNSLHYDNEKKVCRTFKEETVYGYDWMVNTVEDAFEVAIIFDFLNKKIEVKTAEEVTKDKANVLYSFNNFMKEIKVEEDASEIITVLNCNGNNCNITNVNPTGTNYICDFSYYMDKTKQRWMSLELINKLEKWKADCETKKGDYVTKISELLAEQEKKTKAEAQLQEMSLSLQELKNAQLERGIIHTGKAEDAGKKCGIVLAEHVDADSTSIDAASYYSKYLFDPTISDMEIPNTGSRAPFVAYDDKTPDGEAALNYDESTSQWEFASNGLTKTDTPHNLVAFNTSDANKGTSIAYEYFPDPDDKTCYCVLTKASKVDTSGDEPKAINYCTGFDRYIALVHPTTSGGVTTYKDKLQYWINLKEAKVAELNNMNNDLADNIAKINKELESISSSLNIFNYFSDSPDLLRELNQYWIEGDYTNENIAVLDNTTTEEAIELANELMETGYVELSKVCQPRYSFSIDSVDAIKCREFETQMNELELGKIITIEKEENLWYYPALLEINMSLDSRDSFSMTFANAMRLDDWGYTYADLISDVSSTSRKVDSNWQNILKYAKERESIEPLIKNPLDMTLRASFANMVNQEFTIDSNGILGRKFKAQDSEIKEFEDEQVRLVNNVLIFTSDNWKTARAALGRIYYGDEENPTTAYGLIADTIIGTLMMSETLSIKNKNSTIQLDDAGITIKKADGTEVFKAGVDGSLVVNNHVTSGDFETFKYNTETSFSSLNGQISAKVSTSGGTNSSFSWTLDEKGFYLHSNGALVMSVDSSELSLTGIINAKAGGNIAGWDILEHSIQKTVAMSDGTYRTTGLQIPSSGTWSIAAGATDKDSWVTAPFRVDHYGNMYASSGTIGNWNISSDRLQFLDDTHWTIFYPGGVDLYCADGKYRHLTIGVGSPDAMQFGVTDNGHLYANGANIEGVITATSGTIGGCTIDANGKLTIENANITELSVDKILPGTNNNAVTFTNITVANGAKIGDWQINDGAIYASANAYLATDALYATQSASSAGAFKATWFDIAESCGTMTSDRRLKDGIKYLDNHIDYDEFFDSLSPCSFKYKKEAAAGDINYIHFGFIAQDVVASSDRYLQNEPLSAVWVSSDDYYKLNKQEIIALNTWQIQKLKARVAELEKIVGKLT